ncbi:MAG: hypothetical protein LRY68_02440 [Sulfurospirillum sp.]|nr:hypothetical protein [Sulfurospirillum sp.]
MTTIFMFQALFAGEVYATFDVVSEKSSELGLSISGMVGSLHVEVGSRAKKGDLLLSLYNAEEKNAYEIAQKKMRNTPKKSMSVMPKSQMSLTKRRWKITSTIETSNALPLKAKRLSIKKPNFVPLMIWW